MSARCIKPLCPPTCCGCNHAIPDPKELAARLSDEADQCRNDGADDIASLLDDALKLAKLHDAAQAQIARVEAERDELKALYEARDLDVVTLNAQANELRCLVASRAAELHEALARVAGLEKAARAVVDRWDTPLWKDAPHTAVQINRLRDALATSPATQEPPAGAEGVL